MFDRIKLQLDRQIATDDFFIMTKNNTKGEKQQQRRLKNTRKNTKKLKATVKKTINNTIKKQKGFQFIRNNTKGEE
jgi:hypothetical protein